MGLDRSNYLRIGSRWLWTPRNFTGMVRIASELERGQVWLQVEIVDVFRQKT
jgi:hypothetical protein